MRIIDTFSLKNMMSRSRALGYSRVLTRQEMDLLDQKGCHLLSSPILFDNDRVRCMSVLLRLTGQVEPWLRSLDFTLTDYQAIPDYEGQETAP